MAADTPKIVLTPLERSHYFNRRECVANEPLKVGRSVDRRRISPNNLIFDCRVLSRNHALIWFENGKFFIKDTKSSNGTFVNENRLSPSGEESGPVELKSRDVVQFGVNVNVDKKVTHGCIIATVKLYMNDVEVPGHEPPVQQVLQILMSALSREQELETKLVSMQSVLNIAKELATDSMIAIVKEDELMSRLEMLENQLQIYSRNASDSELKKQLTLAFEDKHKNELASKDSLRVILQEKLECVSKLTQLQRDYDKAEQECQKYRSLLDQAKDEHSQEMTKLREQLRISEQECKELETKFTEEKKNLSTNLESLQAESDFTKSQLEKAKDRLSETEMELVELKITMETERQRRAKDILSESSTEEGSNIPPGTESPLNVTNTLVPPGTEDPAGVTTDLTPKINAEGVELSPVRPSSEESRSASPLNRRSTILASALESRPQQVSTARLRSLETELRVSQGRVKLLEEQLGVAPSSDIEPYANEDIAVVAKKLSDSAINKGQVEVLQQSLLQAENLIEELKAKKLSSADMAPDSRGINDTSQDNELEAKGGTVARLKDEVSSLHSSMDTLESRLHSSRSSYQQVQEEKRGLEIELTMVSTRFATQMQDSSRMVTKNEELEMRNEDLQRRVDELCSTLIKPPQKASGLSKVRTPSSSYHPPPIDPALDPSLRRLEEEKQHVRILTIIALVSIGVALVSWFI